MNNNIIGFPQQQSKGPPMGFYEIKTKTNPEGSMHYGYLCVLTTWIGIADEDSNIVYAVSLDQLLEVTRKSVDIGQSLIN